MKNGLTIKAVFFSTLAIAALVSSCNSEPSKVELRKMEMLKRDSLEVAQAKIDMRAADSIATFKGFELEEMMSGFVLEKQEKYQTVGYYVLPAYKGDKSRFSFFPEVEENGKMLLVSIDKKRQYTFTEVDLEKNDLAAKLPADISPAVRADVDKCMSLALAMKELSDAKKMKEKMELKIKFYEKKHKKNKE